MGDSEPNKIKGKGRSWTIGVTVVVVLLGLAVFVWFFWMGERGQEEELAYGFSGAVYRLGEPRHEIVYGEGVERETLESLGVYLEQIGYFSPDFGGVVQIRSRVPGYEVYLSYSKGFWDLPEFIEEVSSIREDLEENVLRLPTRIILADEDETGVSTRSLDIE